VAALRAALADARGRMKTLKAEATKEIKGLKEALQAAQKRESEIRKLVSKKIEVMVAHGEKWEKSAMKQIEKKLSGKKTRRRRPAKKA
jgi:hypothetical protein